MAVTDRVPRRLTLARMKHRSSIRLVSRYEFQEWKAVTEEMINDIGTTEWLLKYDGTWNGYKKESHDP